MGHRPVNLTPAQTQNHLLALTVEGAMGVLVSRLQSMFRTVNAWPKTILSTRCKASWSYCNRTGRTSKFLYSVNNFLRCCLLAEACSTMSTVIQAQLARGWMCPQKTVMLLQFLDIHHMVNTTTTCSMWVRLWAALLFPLPYKSHKDVPPSILIVVEPTMTQQYPYGVKNLEANAV